ncbi:MAG: hypothetical protein J6Q82_03835 [Clostridia bacterium]|nr:hypothetical protein [Clostridia bacterium]
MEQNTPLRRTALFYTIIAFATAMISLVLQELSLIISYDTEIGYFESGAILPIITLVFGIASILFFALFSFLNFRKKEVAYPKATHPAVKLASAICAAISLLLGIYDLKAGSSVPELLFCFGACLYFLLILTSKTTPALSLVFGFCVILRLLTALAASYGNLFLPMNSPEKLWLSTAIVAAMFFLVSEIRALVTKPYTALWFFSAASAVSMLWPSSLILIQGSNEGVFYQPTDTGTMIFAFLLFAMSIYATMRLFTVAINPLPVEAPEVIDDPTEDIEKIEETEETEPTEESQETDNE